MYQSREILTSLPRFDLVTLTFHENSNCGRENYWKSGVRTPAPEGQLFFLFILEFFSQNWVSLILTIFRYLVLLFRNQIKQRNAFFLWRIWKWTEKGQPLLSGDSNPRFSVLFARMIWIFMEGESDEIKWKQASKRHRTLVASAYLPMISEVKKVFFYFFPACF